MNLRSAAVILQEEIEGPIVLPFADSGFGDYYCMAFENGQPAGILFWDHEEGAMTLLFEQFSDLLQAMDLPE